MLFLGTFAKMGPEERRRALVDLTSAPPNGVRVAAEIRTLEKRYEMTSETMRDRVRQGQLDTADTARWLVLLDALGR
jgi:hypothetical protein